ncbi:MAG: phage minor head protein [Bacteroidota bacterium]|nr:phage minor head protein [Bacteroidota bacterium]
MAESETFEALKEKLVTLVSSEFINRFGLLLTDSLVTADSIGRSYVVDKDKSFSDGKKVLSAKFQIGKYVTRADGVRWILAADSGVKISFDLTPDQAIEFFRRKAFWISGIENEKFIAEVKRELEKALTQGTSYQDFTEQFKNFYLSYGIVPDNAIRLDTIFRTNLFTSYTAGQLKQVEQVKDRFPVWRYVSVLDNRTRQSHRNLSGKLFRNGPYPPINFNCRCTPQFIHEFQLERNTEPIYDSIYEFISEDEVVDFIGSNSFDSWIADNPVSTDVQSIIEAGLS